MKNSSGYYLFDINKRDILEIPQNVYYYLDLIESEDVIADDDTLHYIEVLKKRGYLKENRNRVGGNFPN